jgi:valyl-tRNA synthetase
MSKTNGNVIDPVEVMNNNGGYDVLALGLLLQVVPNGNICFGFNEIMRSRTIILKLANAVEYLLGKINDQELKESDLIARHFMYLLQQQESKYHEYLNSLQIHVALSSTIDFMYSVCDFLIEFSKQLIKVLKMCLNGCLRMFFRFMPENCETLLNKINNTSILNTLYVRTYDAQEQEVVANLILLIRKIRSLTFLRISIHNSNSYLTIITKVCAVKVSQTYNCTLLGYKILVENVHLINDTILKIDKRIWEIDQFFEKCDVSQVPDNIRHKKM